LTIVMAAVSFERTESLPPRSVHRDDFDAAEVDDASASGSSVSPKVTAPMRVEPQRPHSKSDLGFIRAVDDDFISVRAVVTNRDAGAVAPTGFTMNNSL
jgi:hypothetical protein